ncbi:MAG: hypothetical protein F6K58_19905 [Symploca sp. SIO2E9]|nr:hypothetical protein [Symploca sp. SIO2E9]
MRHVSGEVIDKFSEKYGGDALTAFEWVDDLKAIAAILTSYRMHKMCGSLSDQEAFESAWEYTWTFCDVSIFTADFPDIYEDIKGLVLDFDLDQEQISFSLLLKSIEDVLLERLEKSKSELEAA